MVVGILLAAGFGRRFGSNKLLALLGDQPLFSYSIKAAQKSHLDHLVVVTQYPEIHQFCAQNGVQSVDNPTASLGQSSSVVLGVQAADPTAQLLFLLADQPLVSSQLINQILTTAQAHPGKILQPVVGGLPTSPVLFPPSLRQELLALKGDQGGRSIINAHPQLVVPIPLRNGELLGDVDQAEDLAALQNKLF